MQRNFAAFLVLSFGVLIGWMALVAWLRPTGTLVVTPAEGVAVEGVTIVATKGEEKRQLDPKTARHRLDVGDYTLSIEGGEDLTLSRDEVTIEIDDENAPPNEIFISKKPKKGPPPAIAKAAGAPRAPEPDDDAAAVAAPAKVARKRVTLGSLADGTPFRMLVTFDNAGAAVERIELANKRYYDVDATSGYLGHLALADAPGGTGAVVGVVGAGTPADDAALKPGDIVTALDGERVGDADGVHEWLAETSPGQSIEIEINRGGEKRKLPAILASHPLAVVRPEIENRHLRKHSPEPADRGANDPLSFLMTLTQVGDQFLAKGEEMPGIDLRTAPWEISEQRVDSVTFRRTLDKHGVRVTKRYTLAQADAEERDNEDAKAYHLTLRITIERLGDAAAKIAYQFDGPTGLPTEGWWYAREGRDYVVNTATDGFEKTRLVDAIHGDSKAGENDKQEITFLGINAQYFAAAVLPAHEDKLSHRPVIVGDVTPKYEILTNITSRLSTDEIVLDANRPKIEHDYTLFAGPKRPELLEQYGLERTIDYGWPVWAWIARILQSVLHMFAGVFGGNYGLAILMLTVVVRLAMFPLSRKQVQGAIKMQELQPEIKRINEQYKKDLEGRNKALGALFRKHNYHPLAGCLPILIQLPIFIGLYNALYVDLGLRQAALIPGIRWCSNLAAPDMFLDWSGWMPNWVIHGGLWGVLPPALGPYLNILPLFTIALMIVQQKMFTPPPTNEQAEMQQKIMKYMMLVLGLMFFKVASGLCLYFICSSLWGIGERKLMPKAAKVESSVDATPELPPARAASNGAAKSKPKKKQQRRR